MSEIVNDLKLANLEINDRLGLTLSSETSRVAHTGTDTLVISSTGNCVVTSNVNLTLVGGGDVTVATINNTKKVNICNPGNSLSFFETTGIDQFDTSGTSDPPGEGASGDTVTRGSIFSGGVGVGNAAYNINDIVRALKQYGLLVKDD
jgi:hypothetical protein